MYNTHIAKAIELLDQATTIDALGLITVTDAAKVQLAHAHAVIGCAIAVDGVRFRLPASNASPADVPDYLGGQLHTDGGTPA